MCPLTQGNTYCHVLSVNRLFPNFLKDSIFLSMFFIFVLALWFLWAVVSTKCQSLVFCKMYQRKEKEKGDMRNEKNATGCEVIYSNKKKVGWIFG